MAPAVARLYQGSIYILPACPPLHGDELKNRPVVLITPPDVLKNPNSIVMPLVVVACSTTPQVPDSQKIRLPDKSTQPQTTTGLREPTWAVPAWRVAVEWNRFAKLEMIGYLTKNRLAELMLMVMKTANVVPLIYTAQRR